MRIRGWTAKCRVRRLNSNKKKGQDPYSYKKVFIPLVDGPEIGKMWYGWEIIEVWLEQRGFY